MRNFHSVVLNVTVLNCLQSYWVCCKG